jgi:hypothetical protein
MRALDGVHSNSQAHHLIATALAALDADALLGIGIYLLVCDQILTNALASRSAYRQQRLVAQAFILLLQSARRLFYSCYLLFNQQQVMCV